MRRLIGATVSGTVVALGIVAVGRGAIPEPGSIRWPLALGALGLAIVANNVVCGLRWRLFLADGRSAWAAVRTYSEAVFLSTFVPFGGEVYRAWGGRQAIDAVVTDRALSGLAIAVAAAASAAAIPWNPVVTVVAVGVASGAWFLIRRRLDGRVAITPGKLVAAMSMSALYIVISASVFLLLFHGAGLSIALDEVLALTPAVLLAAAVPSISGVGPGLIVLGAFATARGADPSQAATVVALLLGAHLILGAFGGALLVGRRVARRIS